MDYIARGVFHPAGGAGTVFIPVYCSPVGPIQDGSESAATEKFIIIIIIIIIYQYILFKSGSFL